MSNPIPIAISGNQSKTMSSLEIASLTGKQHKDVLETIRKTLDEAEISTAEFSAVYKNSQNKDMPCFNLPRRECDLVIAGYSVKYRLAIIDRWQELESVNQLRLPQTYAEALRALADESEAKQKALEKIEEQKQIISVKDGFIKVSNEASIKAGEMLIREFVKSVGLIYIGEKKFFEWMREQKIVSDKNEPYQQYVSMGYFAWKPSAEMHGGAYRYTLRVTPRGKIWLANKYMAYLDAEGK